MDRREEPLEGEVAALRAEARQRREELGQVEDKLESAKKRLREGDLPEYPPRPPLGPRLLLLVPMGTCAVAPWLVGASYGSDLFDQDLYVAILTVLGLTSPLLAFLLLIPVTRVRPPALWPHVVTSSLAIPLLLGSTTLVAAFAILGAGSLGGRPTSLWESWKTASVLNEVRMTALTLGVLVPLVLFFRGLWFGGLDLARRWRVRGRRRATGGSEG